MSKAYDEKWFIERMKKTFHTIVPKKKVSCETYGFYHKDIDDSIIPVEHLRLLPDPLQLQSYIYTDELGNEWIAGIVLESTTKKLLYEIWLKNRKSLAYEIYVD